MTLYITHQLVYRKKSLCNQKILKPAIRLIGTKLNSMAHAQNYLFNFFKFKIKLKNITYKHSKKIQLINILKLRHFYSDIIQVLNCAMT